MPSGEGDGVPASEGGSKAWSSSGLTPGTKTSRLRGSTIGRAEGWVDVSVGAGVARPDVTAGGEAVRIGDKVGAIDGTGFALGTGVDVWGAAGVGVGLAESVGVGVLAGVGGEPLGDGA